MSEHTARAGTRPGTAEERVPERDQVPRYNCLPPPITAPRPNQMDGVEGRLRLSCEYRQELRKTVLALCEQQQPLRVVRAFSTVDAPTLIHLHNLSGGVLGGDRLELTVNVGREAQVQLTSTGATRIYRSRAGLPPATQRNVVVVEENGLLEWLPDPLIPYAGSRYCQETRIHLAAGAGLFWWEIVAPGRDARGEIWAYDLLQMTLDIEAEGRPVALERIRLEPALRPLSSPARLGPYRYFASLYICRVGLEPARWLCLEQELAEEAQSRSQINSELWGISTLPQHGLVVRALSCTGRANAAGLHAFWRAARVALYGEAAPLPRKLY